MQEDKETSQINAAFLKEDVYIIECFYCLTRLCKRGMKSFLVADEKVELYSTDQVDNSAVRLTDEDYKTENCFCRVQNMACLQCGNVVGYHVKQPCMPCLQSQNNGHYWMFYRSSVIPGARLNTEGTDRLVWGDLPAYEKDDFTDLYEECER